MLSEYGNFGCFRSDGYMENATRNRQDVGETSELELNVVDGIILPNLRMNGTREVCSFLNEEGRCSIHPYRPGICRLFPLGRYYEKNGFHYFLQIDECRKKSRGKMKVKKWLGIPELKHYEAYIVSWHQLILAGGTSSLIRVKME